MKLRNMLAAYALIKGVVKYRESKQHSPADKNETDENYFRCDDASGDGRGDY